MKIGEYKQMMDYLTGPRNKLQPIAFETGDRGTEGVRYTAAEAKALKKEFENFPGLTLTKDGKSYYVTYRRTKAGKKIASYVELPATKDNIEKLKKVHEITMKKFYPKILTNAEFEKLRLLDENINLTDDEFAKKLTEVYDKTTVQGKEWNGSRVRGIQRSLKIEDQLRPDILKGGPGQGRSVNEAKAIIRAFNKTELDALNLIKDPEERKRAIQKKASTIVAAENAMKTKGSMHGVQKSTSGDLWKNFYESAKKNDRIIISGTFNGKDLRFSKNFPRNKDGKVNWFIKDKNGVPAWKQIEFTDTATPKGSVTFKWDPTDRFGNLQAQVDNAFGAGHFARSTSAYQRQRELFKTPFTLDGVEGTNFGNTVARNTIINKYKANNNGRMPSEKYIQNRIPQYSPSQVHHFRGGVGNDPYSTQLVSRIANKQLGAAESRHAKAIVAAKGNVEKIKAADDVLIGKIKEISNQYGGIKYEFGGKKFGSAATTESIMETAVKGIGADEQTTKRLLAVIGCPGNAKGGRIGFQEGTVPTQQCIIKGANVVNQGNVKNLSQAQRMNLEKFLKLGYRGIRTVMKFGVIPEAIFATGESLLRVGMGDTLPEAFLRSIDYLVKGDQTAKAQASKIARTIGKDEANLFKDVADFRNAQKNFKTAKSNLETNQAVLDGSGFGYTANIDGISQQEIDERKIKEAKKELFLKKVSPDAITLADYLSDKADDISKSKSFFTKAFAKQKEFAQTLAPVTDESGLNFDLNNYTGFNTKPVEVFPNFRDTALRDPDQIIKDVNTSYRAGEFGPVGLESSRDAAAKDAFEDIREFDFTKTASLNELADKYGVEQIFGANPENQLQKILPPGASFSPQLQGSFAGGGIAGLSGGIDKGPQVKSMNPDSGGLAFFQNNVKKL